MVDRGDVEPGSFVTAVETLVGKFDLVGVVVLVMLALVLIVSVAGEV